jgi:hypothetical protein
VSGAVSEGRGVRTPEFNIAQVDVTMPGRERDVMRRWIQAVAIAVPLVMAAQVAWSVPAEIDQVNLFGGGFTRWDPENDDSGCESDTGYSSVSDGEILSPTVERDDAYDGGLVLVVGSETFADPDDVGDVSVRNNSLAVGPATLEGLRVSRTDRALATSPTLRSLIKLRNPGPAQTWDIIWDSNLGSDGGEEVRATSNGDTTYQLGDRWVVSSDDATEPSDPVLTHVLFGKSNPREKTVEIIEPPEGTGCFTVRFSVRVPADSTRYLLFFTEMTKTHGGAENKAGKFNDRNLNDKLLKAIKAKVRNRVLNWDL